MNHDNNNMKIAESTYFNTKSLHRKTFVNDATNEKYDVGTHVYPAQQLCDTYKSIAENGGDDFYTGHLADLLVEDLKDVGSVITKQDLKEYR